MDGLFCPSVRIHLPKGRALWLRREPPPCEHGDRRSIEQLFIDRLRPTNPRPF